MFRQAADGTGAVERLTESPNTQYPSAVSPDGRRLIFTEEAPRTADDVMMMELDGTRRVTPLVQSPFNERNGSVSPDGRWLAYEANDSGRVEVYVRPFPDVSSGHWQVSTNGGTRPIWTRSGQELVYVSPTGALMRVGVARGPSWAATTPTQVVKEGYFTIPQLVGPLVRHFTRRPAVPDAQRGRRRWDRRACEHHRRAALGRGAEAARADEIARARPYQRGETFSECATR